MNQPKDSLLNIRKSWKSMVGAHGVCVEKTVHEVSMDAELLRRITHAGQNSYLKSINWDPPLKGSPERQAQWFASRRALLEVADQLQLAGYLPQKAWASLSHTSDRILAIGAPMGAPGADVIQGIGVDLELAARPVSARLMDKVTALGEKGLGLSALDKWVIKEACLKAHASGPTDRLVSQYGISSFEKDGTGRAHYLGGHDSVFEFKLERGEFLVALCISKTGKS